MQCSICGDYRQFLLDNGGKPFSFRNAGEPGYMQPSTEVASQHRTDGCEPLYEDGEWRTACDYQISQQLQLIDAEMVQHFVSEYALKSWMREHGREPDPLSANTVEEYLGEWLMMMRESDSEYLADQEFEAA